MTTERRHRVRTHGRESRERNNAYLGRHDPKQVLGPATHDIYLGSAMCRSEARYHASIPANRDKNENRSSKAFSPSLFLVDAVHAFLPLVFLSLPDWHALLEPRASLRRALALLGTFLSGFRRLPLQTTNVVGRNRTECQSSCGKA